eukprot:TRINITY_DN59224_c0_g1_i1.p1 TRINITY_DN59224_c0_g1~~TRINITY_DN59224_c0_g1_i1.p1  ORF type:complete len:337 (-),score=76.26 TRINITY_DN59224_c0_g1_i1:112-1122(-)
MKDDLDGIVEAVFQRLYRSAAEEERKAPLHEPAFKRLRRQQYLDAKRLPTWKARSRAFLARAGGAALSSRRLSEEALQSAVMMQHLLEVEATCLEQGDGLQNPEESYTDGLNDQFLLDAPRSRFELNGEVLHWALSRDESREVFVKRLTARLRALAPASLLQLVSTVMSQSGMALLLRSCHYNVAVVGGKHDAAYSLQEPPDKQEGVTVKLVSKKKGFREYLRAGQHDFEPSECDGGSHILHTATIVFLPNGEIDVTDLQEQIEVRVHGSLQPLEIFRTPATGGGEHHLQNNGSEHALRSAAAGCARSVLNFLCCCGDRSRGPRDVTRESLTAHCE